MSEAKQAEQSRTNQRKAKHKKAAQSKAEQSNTKQSGKAEQTQSKAEQSKARKARRAEPPAESLQSQFLKQVENPFCLEAYLEVLKGCWGELGQKRIKNSGSLTPEIVKIAVLGRLGN